MSCKKRWSEELHADDRRLKAGATAKGARISLVITHPVDRLPVFVGQARIRCNHRATTGLKLECEMD